MISYQVIKTSGALHFDYEGKLKLKMIEQKLNDDINKKAQKYVNIINY